MFKLVFYFILVSVNGAPGQIVPVELGPYHGIGMCESSSTTEFEAAKQLVIDEYGEYDHYSGSTCSRIGNGQ